MATNSARDGVSISQIVASILDSYSQMDIPLTWYVFGALVPSFVLFLGSIGGAMYLPYPLGVRLLLPVFGLLAVTSAVIYPRIAIDRLRIEMENKFHLLVTHMTVLSTTNIDRVEVFRRLATQQEEYGELAVEMNRIVQLVDTWNLSLDDACQRRANQVPSDTVSDFLDRLAYTISAGQSLDDFLLNEQNIIINNYKTIYQGSLDNLEVLKDLYLSLVISMSFGLVFAIVLPILTGTDPTLTVAAVLVLFAFVQLGFLVVIRSMVPYDPLWFTTSEMWTKSRVQLVISTVIGSILSILLVIIMLGSFVGNPMFASVFPADIIPRQLYVAIPITPLLIPGITFLQVEKQIKERDDSFPSFIRALGASESAKQSTTSTVLRTLRNKDFGHLTENIDDLYRRLNMRIDDVLAWKYFATESNSYLIQKFSDMYLVGRELGGQPKVLGELISENMNAINQLRERRSQEAVTLIGVLYGISAASAFAFFIGLQVVVIISGMDFDLTNQGMGIGQLLHPGVYNIDVIEYLLLLLILFNALLASILIRTTDGGHKGNGLIHFVLLTWVGCLTGYATVVLVEMFMSI